MNKPSWSWRIIKEVYSDYRENAISHIRKREDRMLESLIADINTAPKFAPIRVQLHSIHELIKSEFKRSRKSNDKPPAIPRIGYTRRVKDQTRPIKKSKKIEGGGVRGAEVEPPDTL